MKGSVSKNSALLRGLLNKLFLSSVGGNQRPPLLVANEVFPESKILESHFPEIHKEITSLINKRELTRYKDIDPVRAAEVSENWKLYYALFMWEENERARTDCPTLLKLIKNMPNVINATVAVLEPRVKLAAHEGPYAGILRYHIGIEVPEKNPPYIRVMNEYHTWEVGKSIVLDDCYEHEVYNEADNKRVILMIDFMRPMSTPLHFINLCCLKMKKRWGGIMIDKANND
ncbi:aspartyl/asparaginyl beta-hydroxylase domain-containing protein [Xenorhabdus bovienii]|uniref:aspartyl/asparaginyl beta-hydroxylase domain-containing protein n=1 Tax=Xenorhabdus bovienii TaxID=40576 RepID=UPI0023B27BDC|nr:aspartyl/asparaginyl beta-hydroxylase domain-containing protein [Xenorhabdus bovienii]MDE9437869.1 aspartyl/asparaginyl beta-hydroxylase domain-containing protein [Xenorhabdus bovienii]MDE9466900.1 aspartyl/asparaginyl beta-hydroxylase domain-containing protein [Xenorhabdus bovienii]MDE9499647.1 aspartyl/asparaginyl beta-hydroxylase domain-containing protein [Xenorhabdus bovienii]